MRRTFQKKLTAFTLAAALSVGCLTVSSVPAKAVSDADDDSEIEVTNEKVVVNLQKNESMHLDSSMGLIGLDYFNFRFEDDTVDTSRTAITTASLPAAYSSVDKGYVTAVKDQNPYGTCWSFAATSVIESYLLRHGMKFGGKKYNKDNLNLSEKYMAYFVYHPYNDPLKNNPGDKVTFNSLNPSFSSKEGYLVLGGNSIRYAVTLANYEGCVAESYAPYNNKDLKGSKDYKSKISLKKLKQYAMNGFDNAGNSVPNFKNMATVKSIIKKDGAAVATYGHLYAGDATPQNYYFPSGQQTNHDVTIVGWDDNYPSTSFDYAPPGNGAWLIKNSWADYNGNGGYFWMSYYEPTLMFVSAYEMTTKKYDNNYFYSNMPMVMDIYMNDGYGNASTTMQFANTFTIKVKGTKYETIKSVGFGSSFAGTSYSIQMYLNSKKNKPKSGKKLLAKPQTGKFKDPGYITVDLKKPVSVKSGDKVTVVVTFKNPYGATAWVNMDNASETGLDSRANYAGKSSGTNTLIGSGNTFYKASDVVIYNGYSKFGEGTTPVLNMYTDTPDTKVTGISSSGKKVTLKFSKVGGAGGYRIYRSTSKNGKYTLAGTSKKATYTDSNGLSKGKTYFYKVVPIKKIGKKTYEGKKSKAVSVKVK